MAAPIARTATHWASLRPSLLSIAYRPAHVKKSVYALAILERTPSAQNPSLDR